MTAFLSQTLFPALLNMSLTAGIVILCVMATRLALKRAPKVFSYALWAAVLFRLLCPVSLSAGFSLLGALDAPAKQAGPAVSTLTYVQPQQQPETLPQTAAPETPATEPAAPAAPEQQTAPAVDWSAVTAWVWLAGVLGMAGYSIFALLRLRRRLVGSLHLRDNLYLADHISTPFVLGLVRPRIYLPSTLTEGEMGYIIRHEQYHIRHGDHVVKVLAFAALCLHWFNPLVWAAFVLAGRDMEMRCDEAVAKKLGESVKADYSASLLALATGRLTIAGTPLAFGEGDTRGRIRNLLRWKRPRVWLSAVACMACVAVIAACAANPVGQAMDSAKEGLDLPPHVEEWSVLDLGPSGEENINIPVPLSAAEPWAPIRAGQDLDGEEEVTTGDIAETLASLTLSDGTEVLFYRALSGEKYCAYIPAGTERLIRFTWEDNGYGSGGYSISTFEHVLGRSGFRIQCPRGAAYYADDYYYFDAGGTLWQLADCGSTARQTDLDQDGERELLWDYHGGREVYFLSRVGDQLRRADLCTMTLEALGYRQDGGAQITLELPETADADSLAYTVLLPDQGSTDAGKQLTGTIRLAADQLEIHPDAGGVI